MQAIHHLILSLIALFERVPAAFVHLWLRAGVFITFWSSGYGKLDNWAGEGGTIELFRDEYKVPVIPPEIAAVLGTSVEIGGSLLVLFGLCSRFAALALLGLVSVIQFTVYPEYWREHLPWSAMLLFVIVRGPGAWSLDALIAKRFGQRG